jgi:uncharacterized membrane protein
VPDAAVLQERPGVRRHADAAGGNGAWLHINLLAEEKIGKLVSLLEKLRRDIPSVRDRPDAEAEAMSHGTDVREVLEELERSSDREEGTAVRPPKPG